MLDILKSAVDAQASDIHLSVGSPPMLRVNGEMTPMADLPVLTGEETKRMVYSILTEDQRGRFEEQLELDCSYNVPDLGRFRVNALVQKDGVGAVLRLIPSRIPDAEELELPRIITEFADLPRGLVLVTGPTGCGKSTTLAVIIDRVNSTRKGHILTIEDPIEFVYENKDCVVTQREVGSQTISFADALKHALRQDPDVVLVGEMRDLETISLAITIAETGHLVFATLHTTDAPQTVDRVIDVFPAYQQQQVRMQLSVALKAVISQTLLPRADGKGRIAAMEIMVATPAVANLIREGKTHQIYNAIEVGASFGMISLDKALSLLVKEGKVTLEDAIAKAHDPEAVRRGVGMVHSTPYK